MDEWSLKNVLSGLHEDIQQRLEMIRKTMDPLERKAMQVKAYGTNWQINSAMLIARVPALQSGHFRIAISAHLDLIVLQAFELMRQCQCCVHENISEIACGGNARMQSC